MIVSCFAHGQNHLIRYFRAPYDTYGGGYGGGEESAKSPTATRSYLIEKFPVFDDLVGDNQFSFQELTTDVSVTLDALGSRFTFNGSNKYYLYYCYFSKPVLGVPDNNPPDTVIRFPNPKTTIGVSVCIIIEVKDLKGTLDIKTPFDIAAASQLLLASASLDVKTFGLKPTATKLFMPKTMDNIDVKSTEYFESIINSINKLSNENTNPGPVPVPVKFNPIQSSKPKNKLSRSKKG